MMSLPDMRKAVLHWSKLTTVFIVTKSLVEYETIETIRQQTVKLMRAPTGQDLEMKPEGQRAWNSEIVFSDITLELNPDDIIIFDCIDSKRYRVVSKTDYAQFGYLEYKVLSDYSKG